MDKQPSQENTINRSEILSNFNFIDNNDSQFNNIDEISENINNHSYDPEPNLLDGISENNLNIISSVQTNINDEAYQNIISTTNVSINLNDEKLLNRKLERIHDSDKKQKKSGKYDKYAQNDIMLLKFLVKNLKYAMKFTNNYMNECEKLLYIRTCFMRRINSKVIFDLIMNELHTIFSRDISEVDKSVIGEYGKDYNKKIIDKYKNEDSIIGIVLRMTYYEYTILSFFKNDENNEENKEFIRLKTKYGNEILDKIIPIEEVLEDIRNKENNEMIKLGIENDCDEYIRKLKETILNKYLN